MYRSCKDNSEMTAKADKILMLCAWITECEGNGNICECAKAKLRRSQTPDAKYHTGQADTPYEMGVSRRC